jgi:hypothetical protein
MEVDINAFYRVEGYDGIAWSLRGYVEVLLPVYDEDGNEIGWEYDTDQSHVRAVMVGDDREFEFEVSDLTKIDEDDFCHGCGQIGCGH